MIVDLTWRDKPPLFVDKTTKVFIRVACGMIIFIGIKFNAHSVDKFLACLSNSHSCGDVPLMRWKYDLWYGDSSGTKTLELKNK